jgi:DNA invertase Pin-like site-specific DNA recombinase
MRAVIYCRVSTKEQVENLSLPTQERACRDYCDRGGIEVDNVFIEEGESAKTANRTRLQEMLDYCTRNRRRVQLVVVYDLSRFARATHVHSAIRFALKKLGIGLRSATQHIDETPSGQLIENVLASVAQFDNDQRSARTSEGMQAALERGRWVFQPPTGYRKPVHAGGASLEPDPVLAPMVARAFDLMSTGACTKQDALSQVTALGLRTRRGRRLSPQSFSNLLRSEIYMGRVKVPKWGIEQAGDFAPIVSEETFRTVQAVLDGRRPHRDERRRDNPDFPLRRLIRCDSCGKPITGSWSRGRSSRLPYYRCPSGACRMNIRKERLEELFLNALRQLAVEERVVDLFGAVLRDRWQDRNAAADRQRRQLEQRRDELAQRESKLIAAHVYDEKIDADTFTRERSRLATERNEIAAQLHRDETTSPDVDQALGFARRLLSDPARFWQEASVEHRPRLQRAIYPNGLRFKGDLIGTKETSLLFAYLPALGTNEARMASPTGIEPVLPP